MWKRNRAIAVEDFRQHNGTATLNLDSAQVEQYSFCDSGMAPDEIHVAQVQFLEVI